MTVGRSGRVSDARNSPSWRVQGGKIFDLEAGCAAERSTRMQTEKVRRTGQEEPGAVTWKQRGSVGPPPPGSGQ